MIKALLYSLKHDNNFQIHKTEGNPKMGPSWQLPMAVQFLSELTSAHEGMHSPFCQLPKWTSPNVAWEAHFKDGLYF